MTCPRCQGVKRGFGFVMRSGGCAGGCNLEAINCSQCGGSGEITEEMSGWIEAGKKLTEGRQARGLSLREEAARRGLKPSDLSAMEHGRQKPYEAEPGESCGACERE